MKECIGWISDDGNFSSFVKDYVAKYEDECHAGERLGRILERYPIDYISELREFLNKNEDDVRVYMGWEQIKF